MMVFAGLMLPGAGGVRGQDTTAGGGGDATASAAAEARVEGLALSIEGNSLTTGEAISGNWTGWRGPFNVGLSAEKDSPLRMRIAGFIEEAPGGCQVEYIVRETAPVDCTAVDGEAIPMGTRNAWSEAVLLPLDKPVRVLEGNGGNLTLTLTKTTIPRSKAFYTLDGLSGKPQVWRPQNVKLTVQGELPTGSPFKVAMVTGGSWTVLDTEVPVGDTGAGKVQRTGLSVYAMLTPTADGDRLDFKVHGGSAVRLAPGSLGSDSPDYTFKMLGANSSVELKPGVPATVEDANLGKVTFTLEPVGGK